MIDPPPLTSLDPRSFPYYTLNVRLPGIIRQMLQAGDWAGESAVRLQALIDDLPVGKIVIIEDPLAPDAIDWLSDTSPYLGQSWLEVPWLFAEAYFYRRTLQATGYYRPGVGYKRDPYIAQKQNSLAAALGDIQILSRQLERWYDQGESQVENALASLLRLDLLGNLSDLSMWPAGRPGGAPGESHLLIDDTLQIVDDLSHISRKPAQVGFLLDNCGLELAYDLGFVDFLLTAEVVSCVRLHTKPHPTYVSDATILDIHWTVESFQQSSEPTLQRLGERLGQALMGKRLLLTSDYLWTSPHSFRQQSQKFNRLIHSENSPPPGLLIVKGDLNYRRLLGDLAWEYQTPPGEIVQYLEAPLVALRVLKSPVAAGLPADRVRQLQAEEPEWMVNGRWGMIQRFSPGG